MHDCLFQGVVGKAIAWCEDHYGTDYHLVVLLDNVDKTIIKSFFSRADELLGDLGFSENVSGFDPKTGNVVHGTITMKATVIPEKCRLKSGKCHLTIDTNRAYEELSIFPDILSNWLNFEFKEKNKTDLGVPLGRKEVLKGFPLEDFIWGYAVDRQVQPLSETLFRHPKNGGVGASP